MKTTIRSHAVRSLFHDPEPLPPRDLLDPLVRRAAHGDRNAIGALGRSFRPQLLAAACAHVQPADAEDVVQDVFVALLERSLHPPRSREPAVTWLLRTVATLAEQHARHSR